MHINMKYYVVSIGAIFISLGIGMLVGFNMNYDEEISKQQEAIIGDLNIRFEELKEHNNDLEEYLKILEGNYENSINFIEKNSDFLIKDRLIDKNIGIFSTNQENDYNEEIKETIEKASANISFDITINNNIFSEEKVKELSNILEIEFKDTKDIINYIIKSLSEDNSLEKLKNLETLEIIKINYLAENYKEFTSTIIAGGNNGELKEKLFNTIDKPLIESLKNQGKHIVGVERNDSKFSYSKLYFDNKISSIDNINNESGKISLITLLEDVNILGIYGESEESESLIPYKK